MFLVLVSIDACLLVDHVTSDIQSKNNTPVRQNVMTTSLKKRKKEFLLLTLNSEDEILRWWVMIIRAVVMITCLFTSSVRMWCQLIGCCPISIKDETSVHIIIITVWKYRNHLKACVRFTKIYLIKCIFQIIILHNVFTFGEIIII